MRIACIDNSAAERISLQKLIEKSYHESRDILGHVSFPTIYAANKEELLVNTAPNILVFGPGVTIDKLLTLARDLQKNLINTKFCFFLSIENYTLRNLQRLEPFSKTIFSISDPLIRVVHELISITDESIKRASGKLIVVSGVKGGVGATSLVSGFAHAAEAIGKKAVVIDLSIKSVFAVYMGIRKTQSTDYAAILRDNIIVDHSFVEKCIVEAPNGVSVFLPPAGSYEIRELWLKEAELTLAVIDILLELFDLVIVDKSAAEGLLPYALICKASSRVLVTSNDPASIHLLNLQLKDMLDLPGNGRNKIILNRLDDKGLGKKDLVNILRFHTAGGRDDLDLALLSYDARARNWVGTGNTFYTQSSTVTQTILEEMAFALAEQASKANVEEFKIFQVLKRIIKLPDFFIKSKAGPKLLTFDAKFKKNHSDKIDGKIIKQEEPIEVLYQPPVRRIGGSDSYAKSN